MTTIAAASVPNRTVLQPIISFSIMTIANGRIGSSLWCCECFAKRMFSENFKCDILKNKNLMVLVNVWSVVFSYSSHCNLKHWPYGSGTDRTFLKYAQRQNRRKTNKSWAGTFCFLNNGLLCFHISFSFDGFSFRSVFKFGDAERICRSSMVSEARGEPPESSTIAISIQLCRPKSWEETLVAGTYICDDWADRISVLVCVCVWRFGTKSCVGQAHQKQQLARCMRTIL